MPRPPTLVQHVRQVLGRALRETGQALDRLGLRAAQAAVTRHEFHDDPAPYEDFLSRHRQRMPLLHAGRPVLHRDVAYVAPCATLIGSVHVGRNASVWYGAVLRADECLNADAFRGGDSASIEDGREDAAKGILTTGNSLGGSGATAPVPAPPLPGDDDAGPVQVREPWRLAPPEERPSYGGGGAIFVGADSNVQDGCLLTARSGHTVVGRGVTIGHLAQIHSATVEDYCLIGMGSIIREGAHIHAESFVGAGAVVAPGTVVRSGELWVGNPARKIRDLSDKERQRLHYQSSEYVAVATGQHDVMELGGNLGDGAIRDDEDDGDGTKRPKQEGAPQEQPLKIQSG